MLKEKTIDNQPYIYIQNEISNYLPKYKYINGIKFELDEKELVYVLEGTTADESDDSEEDSFLEDYELSAAGYGRQREKFLKENKPELYEKMVLLSSLEYHLKLTEIQANKLEDKIVEDMCKKEGVTEELKKTDMMEWVRKYANILNRGREIVRQQLIYI